MSRPGPQTAAWKSFIQVGKMKKSLLLLSCLCIPLVSMQDAYARDVQLRSRADEVPSINVRGNASTTQNQTRTGTQGLSTEERIARLERILDNQGLVEMLVRLDNLQNELQILRGEIELHNHQLEEIKQRQRDLYVDIDRRLVRLERGGATASEPDTASITPAPATTGETRTPSSSSGAATRAPTPKADFASEQKAYQSAFDLLRELRYEQAVAAFRDFIKAYPDGRYAHIAQYWIGEANYAQRNFKQAIQDYQALIAKYPNSPKIAEAMLKIGYSEYELKNYKQARTTLTKLTKDYPGTTEAGQAQNLIQKIRLKQK